MGTIGEAIEDNLSIYVHCHHPLCSRSTKLDLHALARRLGHDHGVMHQDIAHMFRCQRCIDQGRPLRGAGLTVVPDYGASLRESWSRKRV